MLVSVLRARFLLLLTTVVLADGCVSAPDPAVSRGAAGCYHFDSPYFAVIGRDTSSGELLSLGTADIALLEAPPPPDAFPHGQAPHAVRPIPFAVDTFTTRRWMALSGWAPIPGDSVEVSWRNGLFGPVFRIAFIVDIRHQNAMQH